MTTIRPEEEYHLRWNKHQVNFITSIEELLQNEMFTDVTLRVDRGVSFKCHKMVLAANSSYFQKIFLQTPCNHPVVVLEDVSCTEMKTILEYMYRGEINVPQENLAGLIKVAEFLMIKGLTEESIQKETKKEEISPPNTPVNSSTCCEPKFSTSQPLNFYPNLNPVMQSQSKFDLLWQAIHGLKPISEHSTPMNTSEPILSGSYSQVTDSSPLQRKKLIAHHLRKVLINQNNNNFQESFLSTSYSADNLSMSGTNSEIDFSKINSADESSSNSNSGSISGSPKYLNKPSKIKKGKSKQNWKKYKQYSIDNLKQAINAVQKENISALVAARRYGVPSRTLYDKVKKLGLKTPRGTRLRRKVKSEIMDSAQFPYGIGGNVDGSIYNNCNDSYAHSQEEVEDLSIKSKNSPFDSVNTD